MSQPTSIGPYRILGELGRGGMGVVYLAEDPRLGRDVALKTLPNEVARPAMLAGIEEEARLLASISHPHIATIFSLETDGNSPFLTMERLRGQSLSERLRSSELSLDETLRIARQVASALDAAHRAGILHRDLKPANIMVDLDGDAKVLDFGLAQAHTAASSPTDSPSFDLPTLDETLLTSSRSNDHDSEVTIDAATANESEPAKAPKVSGTPGYMSPEQWLGANLTVQSDHFAFGCVLYECLSGRPAFPGDSIGERAERTRRGWFERESLPEDLPTPVAKLLESCLDPVPSARPDSMADIRRSLDAVLEERRLREALQAKSSGATVSKLPPSLDRFVGRREELRSLDELFRSSSLVTIVGPGGAGKSRLSLEWARADSSREGSLWISLAQVAENQVLDQFLATLGVRETAGAPSPSSPRELLFRTLSLSGALLIVDNCEHVLAEVADLIAEIILQCPKVRILTTSRERLGLAQERVLPLRTLGSEPVSASEHGTAVELFVERARSADPTFVLDETSLPAVQEICERVDGLPLAIELAAARVRSLSVTEIARRLDQRFHLLTGGARGKLPHQRTLHDLITWSHDLLEPTERILFRRLSVFRGGWDLDMAERVCGGNGIEEWDVLDLHSRLHEKSLVQREVSVGEERARYRILESVRCYAAEQLESAGETNDLALRHASYFTKLVEPLPAGSLDSRIERSAWISRCDLEHQNLREALETLLLRGEDNDGAEVLLFAHRLSEFFDLRGYWREGLSYCERALSHPTAQKPTKERGLCLQSAALFSRQRQQLNAAEGYLEEARTIADETSDALAMSHVLNGLGVIASRRGRLDEAESLYTEALRVARENHLDERAASALSNLAVIFWGRNDLDAAFRVFEEVVTLRRKTGDDRGLSTALSGLAMVASKRGDLPEAHRLFGQALKIDRDLGDRAAIAGSLTNLATNLIALGRPNESFSLLEESLSLHEELDNQAGIVFALHGLAGAKEADGQLDEARELYRRALSLAESVGVVPIVTSCREWLEKHDNP